MTAPELSSNASPDLSPGLRIGFDVPFEPFGLLREGQPAGMLVELVAAMCNEAGIAHHFVTMPLAETEPALLSGAVDALAFKGVTPERLPRMDFSDLLITTGAAIFTRIGSAHSDALEDFYGKTVVSPRKGPMWSFIERQHPALHLIDGDNYENAFAMLADGRADLAALNFHAGCAIARRLFPGQFNLPVTSYVPLPVALAMAKGRHPDLLARLNLALATLRRDGRWQQIHDRWMA
jgi:ABC-type amino acid transport substrate-binding protein